MIDIRNNSIYFFIIGITLAFGLLGWLRPEWLLQFQYPLLGVLMVLIGLPHGATDFLLFRRLQGKVLSKKQIFRFFLFYLLAAFCYLLVWLIWPIPALLFFLVISAFHFGQSNWQSSRVPSGLSFWLYMLWGAFVLGGALLWHWDKSSLIIGQLIGCRLEWSTSAMANIQWGLLCINILAIVVLWVSGRIDRRQGLFEMASLVVLSFMLYQTPLLVGFTVYFTLWHSLGSLFQQLTFFRRSWPSFTLLEYYRQAAPYTLLSLLGLWGMALGQPLFFSGFSLISLFFILLACVTLPHIFLIEGSFK
ncbi:MAG: Brp/Blh family beta-carotene 15,15'-dioxygenase [Saprospiraceae bacterium]